MIWIELLKYGISATGLSAVIIFISKKILDRSLDIALEKYKASLNKELETHKSQLNIECERHKSELDRITVEHQIKFSKLHEDRALAIKELYDSLLSMEKSLEHFTSTWQDQDDLNDPVKEEDSRNRLSKLKDLLETKRIYFKEEFCEKIENALGEYAKIITKMHSVKVDEKHTKNKLERGYNVPFEEAQQQTKKWVGVESAVRNELVQTRIDLANDFRALIGV